MTATYNTSLNQIPAIVKKYKDKLTGNVLNYGCGRGWRKVENFLHQEGTRVDSYDKYGDSYLRIPKVGNFDNIICANVLNVCDDTLLKETIEDIREMVLVGEVYGRGSCTLYISIYEGDRSGEGRITKRGFQRNQKAFNYEPMLNKNFGSVKRKGNTFICSKAII